MLLLVQTYFHLSYKDPNIIFFHQCDTGIWSLILLEDGYTQRDLLGVFFIAVVFHEIIDPLDKQLHHRAEHRKLTLKDTYDNNEGGVTDVTTTFVDNVGAVVPYHTYNITSNT